MKTDLQTICLPSHNEISALWKPHQDDEYICLPLHILGALEFHWRRRLECKSHHHATVIWKECCERFSIEQMRAATNFLASLQPTIEAAFNWDGEPNPLSQVPSEMFQFSRN